MLGKGDHTGHGSGRTGKRKTEDQLDGKYKNMDRTNTGGLDKNDGRQKTCHVGATSCMMRPTLEARRAENRTEHLCIV